MRQHPQFLRKVADELESMALAMMKAKVRIERAFDDELSSMNDLEAIDLLERKITVARTLRREALNILNPSEK